MLKHVLLAGVATTFLTQIALADNASNSVIPAVEYAQASSSDEVITGKSPAEALDEQNVKPSAPEEKPSDVVIKEPATSAPETSAATDAIPADTKKPDDMTIVDEKITKDVAVDESEKKDETIVGDKLINPPKHRSVIAPQDAKYAKPEAGMNAEPKTAGADESKQTIEQVMAKAYLYNKQLGAERESVKVTDENVSQTLADWLPTVNANGSRGHQLSDRRGNSVDKTHGISNTESLNLSLPLFDGFGSYNRFKREKTNVEASKARLKTIEQQILLNSAIAYMNVVREKEALQLSRGKEQDLRKHYNDTQSRFDLGEITQTDVSQSYTRLTRSITERMEAEGLYESAKASYQRIVGEEPAGLYLGVHDPVASEEIDKEKLIAEALLNNPEVDVAKHNMVAAKYDVNSKKAALLPSVSLTAGKTWRDGGYLGAGITETHERDVMFNVRVPIYQGGAEYSRIRQAKQTQAKLRYDMEDRKDVIREGVIRAIHDYKVAVSSIEVHQANARTAESALAGLKHEVQVGVRTTIDMLDAEQELYEARLMLLRAQRDKIVNAYALLERLGRLDAQKQHLAVEYHNPDAYYNKMQYQLIGY